REPRQIAAIDRSQFLPHAHSALLLSFISNSVRLMLMTDFKNMFRLDGKVALVVGAGSGIGRAAALGLAAAGAVTICADVNREAAVDTAAELGGADAIGVDITDEAAVDSLVAKYPAIDVVVSTPAVNVRKPLLNYTGEEFDRVLRLNLRGNFHVVRAVGRRMSE